MRNPLLTRTRNKEKQPKAPLQRDVWAKEVAAARAEVKKQLRASVKYKYVEYNGQRVRVRVVGTYFDKRKLGGQGMRFYRYELASGKKFLRKIG